MKILVDKLPETAKECPFATNSTGKYRCRNTARLCPINLGRECPMLAEATTKPKKAKESTT